MLAIIRQFLGVQAPASLEILFEVLDGPPGVLTQGQAPSRGHMGDAGWDLYVSRRVVIPPQTHANVHHDIAVQFPPGVWALITGRSSTLHKKNLIVTNGVLDNAVNPWGLVSWAQ